MKAALTRTRRRKALTGALATLLVVAASSFAYYLIFANGEGSTTQPLGKGTAETVPLTVTFAPGLVPGQAEPITFQVKNTTKTLAKIGWLSWAATTNTAGCLPTWFNVVGPGKGGGGKGGSTINPAIEVAPGGEAVIETGVLTFTEESKVDQTACTTSTLTITATSEP